VLALDVIMQCVAIEVDVDDLDLAAKYARRVVLSPSFAGQHTQPYRPL